MIPFHSNRLMDYNRKKLFEGGYLFLQSIYYGLNMDSVCRKIKYRHRYQFDLNAILSDLIYTRILEPSSKASSFKAAGNFLETPSYELHDVYRALSVLAEEMDFIQAEAYKNSFFFGSRNDATFIMTAQTTISRLSRRTVIENTEKARTTNLTPSSRWGCLPMGMESLWLSPCFPEIRMNRNP